MICVNDYKIQLLFSSIIKPDIFKKLSILNLCLIYYLYHLIIYIVFKIAIKNHQTFHEIMN